MACIQLASWVVILGAVAIGSSQAGLRAPPPRPVIETCFVPGPTDCAELIANEIDRSRATLDMQAYNFTEPHIAAALIRAEARGVHVRVVLDKRAPTERGGKADAVASAGIPVYIDVQPRIAHNKIILLDGTSVIGGSFNYTESADRFNAENVTIIHDPDTACAFEANFAHRLALSEPYVRE
jgi:phosphatidylserine/phosphatidylglycerophosphate/cardiolipin synthase-like enzyme